MTEEQIEIVLTAYAAFLNGEIDREQYEDVRAEIEYGMMEE